MALFGSIGFVKGMIKLGTMNKKYGALIGEVESLKNNGKILESLEKKFESSMHCREMYDHIQETINDNAKDMIFEVITPVSKLESAVGEFVSEKLENQVKEIIAEEKGKDAVSGFEKFKEGLGVCIDTLKKETKGIAEYISDKLIQQGTKTSLDNAREVLKQEELGILDEINGYREDLQNQKDSEQNLDKINELDNKLKEVQQAVDKIETTLRDNNLLSDDINEKIQELKNQLSDSESIDNSNNNQDTNEEKDKETEEESEEDAEESTEEESEEEAEEESEEEPEEETEEEIEEETEEESEEEVEEENEEERMY